jgi:hypothetical protein
LTASYLVTMLELHWITLNSAGRGMAEKAGISVIGLSVDSFATVDTDSRYVNYLVCD